MRLALPTSGALVAASALAAVALLGSAAEPERAAAAPCPIPTFSTDGSGGLALEGTFPCEEDPETLAPYCNAGTVWLGYEVNGVVQGPFDTAVACATPTRIALFGHSGGDKLDLTRVSAATGFTGLTLPNVADGGYGKDLILGSPAANAVSGGPEEDTVLVRNGVADTVDCGTGIDAAQSDQAGVDSLLGCEIADLSPTPPAVAAPTPTTPPTGQRKAAQRRCRKKHGKARRRCFAHAKTLPA